MWAHRMQLDRDIEPWVKDFYPDARFEVVTFLPVLGQHLAKTTDEERMAIILKDLNRVKTELMHDGKEWANDYSLRYDKYSKPPSFVKHAPSAPSREIRFVLHFEKAIISPVHPIVPPWGKFGDGNTFFERDFLDFGVFMESPPFLILRALDRIAVRNLLQVSLDIHALLVLHRVYLTESDNRSDGPAANEEGDSNWTRAAVTGEMHLTLKDWITMVRRNDNIGIRAKSWVKGNHLRPQGSIHAKVEKALNWIAERTEETDFEQGHSSLVKLKKGGKQYKDLKEGLYATLEWVDEMLRMVHPPS
ncbi:hypothetical protein JCM3770_005466 [Rhodotorula araucariae]